MKHILLVLACIFIFCTVFAQQDTAVLNDAYRFQKELVKEYADKATSPLSKEAAKSFKGIHFFPVNTAYIVKAVFKRTTEEKIFGMPTSGSTTKQYLKYAEVNFTLSGKPYKLNVYQSVSLASQRQYRDYLFIPFRDASSGKETYGGGRYIDLTIPYGDTIIINFNKAYQPYCAYTEGYNCPIPPRENYLPVKVEAGVKF